MFAVAQSATEFSVAGYIFCIYRRLETKYQELPLLGMPFALVTMKSNGNASKGGSMREVIQAQFSGSYQLISKMVVCLVAGLLLLPASFGQENVRRFGNEISGPPLDKFAIEIGGKLQGYFTHCSGLGSDSDLVEFRQAGAPTVEKLPGVVKFDETVCRRKVVTDLYFWDWRGIMEKGTATNYRRTANVILYDELNKEVARWELLDAWPSSAFISETKETKGYAEEVIVLVSRQIKRIK